MGFVNGKGKAVVPGELWTSAPTVRSRTVSQRTGGPVRGGTPAGRNGEPHGRCRLISLKKSMIFLGVKSDAITPSKTTFNNLVENG